MSTVYTIGHSTHSLEEFLTLLKHFKITYLVDVRTIPKSRHVPQFNKETFQAALKKEKIIYQNIHELGGLRKPSKDSINSAWRNSAFRGFADYMQTPEFYAALKKLIVLTKEYNVAIMCAEAVPWRCHRSLIADALVVRHIKVCDIISTTSIRPHTLTAFAVVDRTTRPITITYPKQTSQQLELF